MKKNIITIVVIALVAIALIFGYTTYIQDDRETPQLIIDQQQVEAEMQAEFDNGDWTMEDPYLKVNPYDTNELSAYLAFNSDQAYSWTYTVKGKTSEVDFSYQTEESSKEIIVPIFGLYSGDNTVTIDFTAKDGSTQTQEYSITTPSEDDQVVWDIKDEDQFTELMGNKVVIDNYSNVYDQNGDLRIAGVVPYTYYNYSKDVNGKLLIPAAAKKGDAYDTIYETNLMGRLNPDYYLIAPEGTAFHHDMIGVDGLVYALITPRGTESEDNVRESRIAVYNKRGIQTDDIEIKDLVITEGNKAAANSALYDVHLNGIDYIAEENQLVLSSRSFSAVYGYDLDTNQIEWVLDEPATTDLDNVLTPVGDVDYASGQHTPIVLTEDMDLPYFEFEEGKYYVSIFDNQSSIGEDGNEVVKSFTVKETDYGKHSTGKSQGIIYAIDLEEMTVEEVYKVTGNFATGFMGSYRPTTKYQELYSAIQGQYELFDTEGNLIADGFITNSLESGMSEDEPFSYRIRTISLDDLLQYNA